VVTDLDLYWSGTGFQFQLVYSVSNQMTGHYLKVGHDGLLSNPCLVSNRSNL